MYTGFFSYCCVGTCSCGTKTPELSAHDPDCKYRWINEKFSEWEKNRNPELFDNIFERLEYYITKLLQTLELLAKNQLEEDNLSLLIDKANGTISNELRNGPTKLSETAIQTIIPTNNDYIKLQTEYNQVKYKSNLLKGEIEYLKQRISATKSEIEYKQSIN